MKRLYFQAEGAELEQEETTSKPPKKHDRCPRMNCVIGSWLVRLLTQYSTGTGSRERNLGLVVVAGPMTVLQVVDWRGVGHLFPRSPNHCA